MKIVLHFICFCAFSGNILARRRLDTNVRSLSSSDSNASGHSYRLPNNTTPEFYDISLVTFIDRNEFSFSGVVEIEVRILEDSTNITLHARQLKIKRVLLRDSSENNINDVTFTYDETREFLTILTTEKLLHRGEKYVLKVFYNGELRTDQAGFFRTSYIDERNTEMFVKLHFIS